MREVRDEMSDQGTDADPFDRTTGRLLALVGAPSPSLDAPGARVEA
jgi:hypothetical protein